MAQSPNTSGHLSVRVAAESQRVRVIAEARADVVVDGDARVEVDQQCTTIDTILSKLTIRVPEGTDIIVGSTSGRVSIEGRVGTVAINTDSGRIQVEQAASVDIRTTSARVEVGHVAGSARVRTTSGRVDISTCGGPADVATESGRINATSCDATVKAHCVSGRIDIGLRSAHDVDLETVSGRVALSLPDGIRAFECATDEQPPTPPAGYDCCVRARSASGRVTVKNA